MEPERSDPRARWHEMAEIFTVVLELPAEERPAFLERRLADDPTLRPRIEALLDADDEASRFLETPALDAWTRLWRSRPSSPRPSHGDRIGRYRLLETLGQGGMATVYLAVRADDAYRQQVAVKLAHHTATDDMLWRFRAERQILAHLEHPSIARLLDGGATGDGLPFLVMEYVEGTAIDRYCDENALTVDERLELFQAVCDAVQYAHQKLVVHRDLKPGNILVTAEGAPKLLDFGIAKLLEPEPGARSDVTESGLLPLTPNYASPEQLRGRAVSTASDVYSLGVLLYRMVTGELPRTFRALTLHEIDRALAREPPPTRLDRDFDAVVARALDVEPERRYASVEQLAGDLRRWAAGHPVHARPQTLGYRAVKFLRRRWASVALAAGIALLVVALAVEQTWQAERVARERDRANAEARKTRELADFLTDLLRHSDPWRTAGRDVTMHEVLARGAAQIRRRLDDEPELRGMLLDTMGSIYLQLAYFERARPLLEEGLAERRRSLPPDHPDVAASLHNLGVLHLSDADYDDAETYFRRALAIRRQRPSTWHTADSLHGLGITLVFKGRYEAAESAHLEALALRLAAFGEDHLDVAASRRELGSLYIETRRLEEADELFQRALASQRHQVGDEHPEVVETLGDLSALRQLQGDLAGAEALLRKVLAIQRSVLGDEHPNVGRTVHNLAGVLVERGELDEAARLYDEVLSLATRFLDEDHRDLAVVHFRIGELKRRQGELEVAESCFRRSLAILRRALPADHPGAARPLLALAELLTDRGEPERAEMLYREALRLRVAALPADHPEIAEARDALRRSVARTREGRTRASEAVPE